VLEAARRAGLDLPRGCKSGNCGACRARLRGGEVTYPHGRPLGLSDAEVRERFILLCQARALSDLCIEAVATSTPDRAVIKRLPARIERVQPLAHDVLGVVLRLPAAEPFACEAGQYMDIVLQGGRRRSFSVASPPQDSRLELHVRRVHGGDFDPLFAGAAHGTLLSIEGPFDYAADSPARQPSMASTRS
jgi:CDP-4-dehydro-6-deoxyglucose reductase